MLLQCNQLRHLWQCDECDPCNQLVSHEALLFSNRLGLVEFHVLEGWCGWQPPILYYRYQEVRQLIEPFGLTSLQTTFLVVKQHFVIGQVEDYV